MHGDSDDEQCHLLRSLASCCPACVSQCIGKELHQQQSAQYLFLMVAFLCGLARNVEARAAHRLRTDVPYRFPHSCNDDSMEVKKINDYTASCAKLPLLRLI